MFFYVIVGKPDEGITNGMLQCPYDEKQIWIVAYTSKTLKKLKRKITCSYLKCPHCKKGIILEFQKSE